MEGRVSRGTVTLANADGTAAKTVATITPQQYGEIGIHLDLSGQSWDANDNDKIITLRLYSMIDGTNLRAIDHASYKINTSTTNPQVIGYVPKGTGTIRATIEIDVAINAGSGTYTIDYDYLEPGV